MKITNVTVLTILAAAVSMAVTTAKALPQVTLNQGNYSYSVGGEFNAVTASAGTFNGNYASSALVGGGFETFCLETGVDFSPGHQYYYTLGSTTMPITGGGTGSGKALSYGAAWLYYEFGKGLLAGYNYSTPSTRKTDAGVLQAAIWAFQGQTESGFPAGGTGNTYYDAAILALGLSTATSDYNGAYVQVLQMWSNADATGPAQNQLVLTGNGPTPSPSVPDGGMTILLLGGALTGVQVLRRKLMS